MLLHLTAKKPFNTESGNVNEACKEKRTFEWIAH